MAEKTNLNDQELENVSGGEYRVVNTGDSRNAAIRSAPGLNTPIIGSLPSIRFFRSFIAAEGSCSAY